MPITMLESEEWGLTKAKAPKACCRWRLQLHGRFLTTIRTEDVARPIGRLPLNQTKRRLALSRFRGPRQRSKEFLLAPQSYTPKHDSQIDLLVELWLPQKLVQVRDAAIYYIVLEVV